MDQTRDEWKYLAKCKYKAKTTRLVYTEIEKWCSYRCQML